MRMIYTAMFSFVLFGCEGKPIEPERNKDGSWNPGEVEAYEEDVRSGGKGQRFESSQVRHPPPD